VRTLLRVGLWSLAAVEIVLGLWTLLLPASFYAVVPTADVTPFSEHPFRDFGGATLGLAVVLGAAALWTETRLVLVSLLAYLAFAVPHLVFHVAHAGVADGAADLAMVAGLVASVLVPLVLLGVALRARSTADVSGGGGGGRAVTVRPPGCAASPAWRPSPDDQRP
jgi:uncharacterized membrane protein (DUF2068 family)